MKTEIDEIIDAFSENEDISTSDGADVDVSVTVQSDSENEDIIVPVEEPKRKAGRPKKIKVDTFIDEDIPKKSKKVKKSKYNKWWASEGIELIRKGHGQRNILLKAAKATGAASDEVMTILAQRGTLREKLLKLFKE